MIDAAGTSQESHSYSLLDLRPPFGMSYYRLKQVDLDGSTWYSDMEAVWFDAPRDVELWPQPNDGRFTIRGRTTDSLHLVDAMGRAIPILVRPGNADNTLEIELVRPSPGLYVIRIEDGSKAIPLIVQ